jgi:hypothetical protein
MAKQEVPWKNLFQNGTLLFVPLTPTEHTDHYIPSLEAFLNPEPENETDPATARGAQ